MKLRITKPIKALNKAYYKLGLRRDFLEQFKHALERLKNRINESESEEHNKNIVSDFLKEGIYTTNYEINVKDRKDLVIHTGKSSSDPIGTIIEVKRPAKSNEMISVDRPNAKALHELLLYYFEERVEKKNLEIRHLIITNLYEWYVFDEIQFEKLFFRNAALMRDYENYKQSGKDTRFFYEDVVKKHLSHLQEDLVVAHFSLKKILDAEAWADESIIPIYKLLSPQHLLKLPFVNDSNTLNKDFYNELLHIIGLEEIKEGSKKVIRRKQADNRDDGSLLENTINILHTDRHLSHVQNLERFGESYDEQLFSIALELSIVWLNRILFLKLLEGQLVTYHKGNTEYAFLNSRVVKDYDDLRELFFEVLAVQEKERKSSVNKKFGSIPYLNSSLFELTELERQTITINSLKHRLEMPVYSSTVLTEPQHPTKRLTRQRHTLDYLLEFLDAYDFGAESTGLVKEQNKSIINASVLGLIFEKLNGYKDGSFFTPGIVTMYICRDTIRKAIIQKFNESCGWQCVSLEDLKEKIDYQEKEKRKKANEIINSLKICDPAVGSGHFLVSALNEIIAIKGELSILSFRDNSRIRDFEIKVEQDELVIIDEDRGSLFHYTLNEQHTPTSETQKLQEALFHEKQTLIENCLFGTDVNQKSALICRLRLWIELLKHAYYTKESNYKCLETLPNIDINIKAGNSLVSRYNLRDTYDKIAPVTKQKIKLATQKYKDQVLIYKETADKKVREQAETRIAQLKEEFTQIADPLDKTYHLLQKKEAELSTEQQRMIFPEQHEEHSEKINRLSQELATLREHYEQRQHILYHDALEWRFEFPEVLDENGNYVGFDVVIGNPPYFSLSKNTRNDYFRSNYCTFNTGGDIYCLFYEQGLRILRPNGRLMYITSNKWMRNTYGEELRDFLLQETNPEFVFDFAWYQVFDNASVDTCLLSFTREENERQLQGSVAKEDFKLENLSEYVAQHSIKLHFDSSEYWNISPVENQNLKEKIESIGKPVDNWNIRINYGIKTGFNDAFIISDKERSSLLAIDKRNGEIIKPFLKGRHVERFGYDKSGLYLINTYNGFLEAIKNPKKNIVTENDGTFSYKPEDSRSWKKAKRIEHTKGNQYRINRVIVETDYPSIYEYLLQFEDELKKREDQGTHWTNLRNCTYDDQFQEEKLIWAETMRVHKTGSRSFPRFGYDAEGFYADKTMFIAIGKHLKFLLAVLNSKLGKWLVTQYIPKLDSGGYTMQKVFLDRIPIVEPDRSSESTIVKLVDQLLAKKKQNISADTGDLEKEIDQLVYKLFSLSGEEISMVESV